MKQIDVSDNPPTIAIVDDHPLMRETICSLLESYGFCVELKLSNGQELLNTLTQLTIFPKICILDIQMPVMNARDTLKKLRELYPGIKTIVYSFTRNEKIISEMMDCGAEGYLFKGCSLEELLSKLRQLCQF